MVVEKLVLFGLSLTGNPLEYGRLRRRVLARCILRRVKEVGGPDNKMQRIKACRYLTCEAGMYEAYQFGLAASRDFVEKAFEDNGYGKIM